MGWGLEPANEVLASLLSPKGLDMGDKWQRSVFPGAFVSWDLGMFRAEPFMGSLEILLSAVPFPTVPMTGHNSTAAGGSNSFLSTSDAALCCWGPSAPPKGPVVRT